MFGRKQREIAQLRQENQKLRGQVNELESDPYFQIAKELGAEVEGIISSGVNMDTQIDDAIKRQRTALFLARVEELAQIEIAQADCRAKS